MEKNKGDLFARYLWLYGEIAGKGPVTFETINNDWMHFSLNPSGEPLPHKTFENHRKSIENMFDIAIECNRSNNTYYIPEGSELIFTRATVDMLNGALLFTRVRGNEAMRKHIRPEQSGGESALLITIASALEDGSGLSLRYRHNYDPQRETLYHVTPVGLKQFRLRWYLIADLGDGHPYSFSLDRIVKLEKGARVEPSPIDIDLLYKDAYGIIREDATPPEKIVLKVESEQANYFFSRPLHRSQRVVERTPDHVVLSLFVCPTYDFIMELLSHGPKVEVLEPQSLRNRLAATIRRMAQLYSHPSPQGLTRSIGIVETSRKVSR